MEKTGWENEPLAMHVHRKREGPRIHCEECAAMMDGEYAEFRIDAVTIDVDSPNDSEPQNPSWGVLAYLQLA